MKETIERITEMEQRFDRATEAIRQMEKALKAYKKAKKDIRQLTKYFDSQQWEDDFIADEEGRLPKDLKRGVISEDGIWDLLNDNQDLLESLRKVVFILVLCFLPFAFAEAQSPLHVVALGDSNTWLAGDSCTNPLGWITVFKEQMQPASCHSYARSGATWTHTASTKYNPKENIEVLGDDNVIYNQVMRLREDCKEGRQALPDLILILAGTNDTWFSTRRPNAFVQTAKEVCGDKQTTITDLQPHEVQSLAGAIRYNCELLRALNPSATIVLITPMQATKVSEEAIRKTGDVIAECGRLLHIPVIRLDDVGITRKQELQHSTYTSDGVHTNLDGARLVGENIKLKVDSLKLKVSL